MHLLHLPLAHVSMISKYVASLKNFLKSVRISRHRHYTLKKKIKKKIKKTRVISTTTRWERRTYERTKQQQPGQPRARKKPVLLCVASLSTLLFPLVTLALRVIHWYLYALRSRVNWPCHSIFVRKFCLHSLVRGSRE